MKWNGLLKGLWFVGFFLVTVVLMISSGPAGAQVPDKEKKFETYRAAVKKDFGIDIKDFKEQLKGGRADGKDITKYDLQQILMGIKIEQEHTSNKMLALEITMDHLEEIPDYYTRLQEMEEEAEEDMEEEKERTKK